jgi:hypothetical protein
LKKIVKIIQKSIGKKCWKMLESWRALEQLQVS